jgi:phospholipid/cholesterol/gamma-HCH transport system permease protein
MADTGTQDAILSVEESPQGLVVRLEGPLTVAQAAKLGGPLAALEAPPGRRVDICLKGVTGFDTAGAWLLYRTMRDLRFHGAQVRYINATPAQEQLIEQALINDAPCPIRPEPLNPITQQIADVGKGAVEIAERLGALLAFLGLVIIRFTLLISRPWKMRWTALTHQLEHVGLKALPIVGLMSFLIGLVLVQQGAWQLRRYGAEIFVVDLVSITTLRELGVLLTAIMVAGRSGSAFTAQIGSMKLQEEVDAMRTIGLNPVDVLVIPRVLALVIMLPLLAFYASMMAMLGGMVFGYLSLDISVDTFLLRLREAATMDDFWVGMIKAPVFGLIVAVVGCFEGMQVEGSAQSVGERTTMSVVQSIFLVIVADAFFAVFFTYIGM